LFLAEARMEVKERTQMFWTFCADIPRGERAGAMRDLLDACEDIYANVGLRPPAWINSVREGLSRGDGIMLGQLEPDPTLHRAARTGAKRCPPPRG